MRRNQDRGISYGRTRTHPREKAFAETWEDECKPRPGINFGMGAAQDLFVQKNRRVVFWLTPRERVIIAEVIQWLGSNCGMAFLNIALRKFGYHIVPLGAARPAPSPPPPKKERKPRAWPEVSLARFVKKRKT